MNKQVHCGRCAESAPSLTEDNGQSCSEWNPAIASTYPAGVFEVSLSVQEGT